MRCILIAGSGTGGHIFPAIAVAKELKRLAKDVRLVFVHAGRKRFDDSGFGELGEVAWVPGTGMPRGFSFKLPVFLFQTMRSLFRSLKIIRKYSPDVAVGFGNFGSYGALRAAASKRMPVFLHEANSIPGKANRFLSKFADCIGVNFPDAGKKFAGRNVEVVGMPIRAEFYDSCNREEAIKYYGLDAGMPILLVTGGSQGARHLNEVVCDCLQSFKNLGIQVIHLAGKDGYEKAHLAYRTAGIKGRVKPFETRMKMAFDAADIIVSRSGASSLAEIAAAGKPAILVPYPFATDDHQWYNAKYFADNNAALLLPDSSLTVENLIGNIKLLLTNEEKKKQISSSCARLFTPDSANRMARIILGMCDKKDRL